MIYSVMKEVSFEAAHYLPKHPGQCSKMHGHCWKVRVKISSYTLPPDGMVIDFGTLKEWLDKYVKAHDHTVLNDVFPTDPTAENLALFIFQDLEAQCSMQPFYVEEVQVQETEGNVAFVRKE